MKKLTKMSLDELAKTMPVLTEAEMKSCRGGDDYLLNNDGTIVKFKDTSGNVDVLYSNGVTSNKVIYDITFSKGILSGMSGKGAAISLKSNSDARQLFEFCAKYSTVEFGMTEANNGATNAVYTSNSAGFLESVSSPQGTNILTHSHPALNGPSPNDFETAKKFPSGTIFRVFTGSNYVYYNKDGIIENKP